MAIFHLLNHGFPKYIGHPNPDVLDPNQDEPAAGYSRAFYCPAVARAHSRLIVCDCCSSALDKCSQPAENPAGTRGGGVRVLTAAAIAGVVAMVAGGGRAQEFNSFPGVSASVSSNGVFVW